MLNVNTKPCAAQRKVPHLSSVAIAVVTSLSSATWAVDVSELEKIESHTTPTEAVERKQKDNSRIYLEQGAIWASRDITRFDPVLTVRASDRIEVKEAKLTSAINFTITTNFSYYIARYQLEIFDGQDVHLSQPIAVLEGDQLANDSDVVWSVEQASKTPLAAGGQLQFRLKAWDQSGNMDLTTLGVIDLTASESEVDIQRNDGEQQLSRRFGQAQLMRHNIPTYAGLIKFIGNGLKGVDKVVIGDDEFDVEDDALYAEQFLPANAYLLPTKVIFDDGEQRDYQLFARVPENYYVQAGLADFYVGRNFVSGNGSALDVDEQYQDNLYNQGRIAYFGQGKFGDKLRITTHFDSREGEIKDLFKHPFASDSSDIFELLEDDDELYYGHYGDNANIRKVVNTKGKVYLDLQYDKSQLLWGNYNTGLTGTDNSDYNRSLYGLKGDFRTRGTTKYGEDKLNVVGFAASSDTLFGHDEFLGTGGSLYFLKNGEVVPGSDKVSVKVINQNSGIAEREVALQSGRDYEIDAYQGRIILTRPLTNILRDNFSTVIDDTPGDGYENYLAVDYEYVPRGSEAKDALTFGGRAKGWVNDYVGLGASYATEARDEQDYQNYSADITLRASEGSYLQAEFGHSQGTQTDSNFVSYDGGLTFNSLSRALEEREGDALQIKAVADLHDVAPNVFSLVGNDIKAWYKSKDAHYSDASQDDDVEQESYGAELRLQASDRIAILTRFTEFQETSLQGIRETDTTQAELEGQFKLTDHIKLSAAGKQIEELNPDKQRGTGSLAGLRADYIWNSDNSIYLKGQKTLSQSQAYDENDSVTLGGEARVMDDITLGAEYTTGSRGDAAQATVNYDITSDYSTYLTYLDDDYEGSNNVIVGQRADLTSNVDFYQENQFVNENSGKGRIDSFGFGYDLSDELEFGIGYQQGEIEKPNSHGVVEVTERRATTFSAQVDVSDVTFKHKLEYRVDKGNDQVDPSRRRIDQVVTTNRYTHHLTDEYTLFGKYNYSNTVSKVTDETLENFVEASVGLAYRPIYHDKLNLLSRYTYLRDKDALDREVNYTNERSKIVEVEGIYSLNAKVDVGAKYAHKDKTQAYERASGRYYTAKSDINLYAISTSYSVMKNWDVTGEYHWKTDTINDQLEHGAVVSFNKHVTDNFKVGIGYNFSGFDNNLANRDDYDAQGVFVNVVGKL
ncbi:hypothetical protein M1D72_03180 [Vibrio sp. AK197]